MFWEIPSQRQTATTSEEENISEFIANWQRNNFSHLVDHRSASEKISNKTTARSSSENIYKVFKSFAWLGRCEEWKRILIKAHYVRLSAQTQ